MDTGRPYNPGVTQLGPGQGTATTLVPGNPPVPDIAIAPGQFVPGAPPSQTTVTRPSFLSAFIQNLGPSIEGAMRAPRGSGFAGGIGGGFAGIEEQNRYDQNLAMQRTEQERKQLLEQSTLLNQQSETALRNAEIENYKRKPADKFLTTFADASGNQTALFQSPTGSPYTVKVGSAKLPEEMQPLGGARISQLNDAMMQRWNVLNPNTKPPSAFLLQPNATEKDFARTDKLLEAVERAQGTKANQQATMALREQTAAIANAARDEQPVYAFDPAQKQTVLTTKGEARSGGMRAVRKVSEADINKDTQMQRQLGDAQMNVSAYRVSSQAMDNLSLSDRRAVAALVGDDKFKAQFMGTQIPVDWFNRLLTNENWRNLPEEAKDAVVGYIGARGAIIAYTKAISGTGRLTESQLQTELKNLPDPSIPADIREKQFDRFQRNLDQASSGLPKIEGVESPSNIRSRIEGEANASKKAKQDAADSATGQFTDPNRSHKVGQLLIFKGKEMTVSKVYKDGSFDME